MYVILLATLFFTTLCLGQWSIISGNLSANAPLDTVTPYPGAMSQHAATVYSGSIYIFGGFGSGYLNDMWRFNTSDYNWFHLYGNLSAGVESDYNTPYPGGLARCKMCEWSNFLYVFGGYHKSTFRLFT